MTKDEKKRQKITRLCIGGTIVVGIGAVVGYHIGKARGLKISRKHTIARWDDLASRIIENGETLGLMIPHDDGTTVYLDVKPASEDYEGMVRGFLNIYTI